MILLVVPEFLSRRIVENPFKKVFSKKSGEGDSVARDIFKKQSKSESDDLMSKFDQEFSGLGLGMMNFGDDTIPGKDGASQSKSTKQVLHHLSE